MLELLYSLGILQQRKWLWIKITFIFLKITLAKIIMLVFINKDKIYLLQNNTNQFLMQILICKKGDIKIFYISFEIVLNNDSVFKT